MRNSRRLSSACLVFFFLFVVRACDAHSTPSRRLPSLSQISLSRLWRRDGETDAGTATIPKPKSIAASQYWDGIDGPWSSFPLQAGSGSVGGLQDVRVFISTASTAIWTIGPQGCPPHYMTGCANSRGDLFLTNQSLTWTPNSIYQTGLEMNLGLDSSGYVGFDVASLGWQGGTAVTDSHSIIWNLADPNWWVGIFGLNPRPTNFSTFADPQTSFMQTLLDKSEIPSLSYAYTAGNRYRLDAVFGSLTLGGYDAHRFIPNNISFDFFEDISRDLLVNLQSITADKGSPSNLLPDGTIPIFIDSTVPEVWLPESACTAFENAFGIEYNTHANRYLINATQRHQLLEENAQITFTLGSKPVGGDTVNITLPYQAFDLQVSFPIVENTSYYFPLMRATNETQYTLGRTFLQEAYLIADYQRQTFSVSQCDWDQERLQTEDIVAIPSLVAVNNTATVTQNDNENLSAAEIAGVAVAGVALLTVIALGTYLIIRQRKRRQRREIAVRAAEKAEALAREAYRPVISHPFGGELGGDGLHEMSAHRGVAEVGNSQSTDPTRHGYSEMAGGYYYKPGKYVHAGVSEIAAAGPLCELPGSDVHEKEAAMPTHPRNERWL